MALQPEALSKTVAQKAGCVLTLVLNQGGGQGRSTPLQALKEHRAHIQSTLRHVISIV